MKWCALIACCGCGRVDFDTRRDAAADANDANGPLIAWGDYAATLPIGACSGPVLMVNDTTDEVDGGTGITDPAQAGPTLSFHEAIWIAKNRGGANQILFDPAVFPADAPATIAISTAVQLPLTLGAGTCIDGRSRGVVVDWSNCFLPNCPPQLDPGSLLVGLTFVGMQYELVARQAQIAGCRLNSDGYAQSQGFRFWTVELAQASELGPGNSIAGLVFAIRIINNTGGIFVHDNGIGYDPVTHAVVPTATGIDLAASVADAVEIDTNVFAASVGVIDDAGVSIATVAINLRGNAIGVDRVGTALGQGLGGITHAKGVMTIGPSNDIENVATAVSVTGGTAVITQNRITHNGAGIAGPPLAAPVITMSTPTHIQGTCTGPGDVEVFADSTDEGAIYLGTTVCGAGVFGLGPGPFPVGQNATATNTVGTSTSAFSAPVPIQ